MFDNYIAKLKMSKSANTEALIENSKTFLDNNFTTSPSYYIVEVNGEEEGVIINRTTNYNVKKVYFKSNSKPELGSLIKYKDEFYILLSKDEDELVLFGDMEECNNTIKIQKEEAKEELVGYDQDGRPHYKEVVNFEDEPCIVRDTYYSTSENAQLPLPNGKLEITIKYQPMLNIDVNKEIIMYEKNYKITDINYVNVIDGVGYVKINAERRQLDHE